MIIKLSVVNTKHVLVFTPKIVHCDGSKNLSEYLSTVLLDDHRPMMFHEVKEVYAGNSFSDSSSIDLASCEFISVEELRSTLSKGK